MAPGANLAAHRRRQRSRGLQRLEVQVRVEDAALVRAIVAALADPAQAEAVRASLTDRFAPRPGLKALLEDAPLDGIDLDRPRDTGRETVF
ncbi:hypothetical protein [Falsiroseomonas ponticola]|uniref:hypothetical protein n=1 Tax=Falsiroseomonas ponticola TaxID=2786951 RepID=UPI001931BDB9|nr:hypothetical protein [Roseomonas ponticola]